jgi:hypothetical protein
MSELSITIGGKPYTGRFAVQDNLVTVHFLYGTKSTQLEGLSVLKIVELLLGELVRASLNS